MPSRWNRDRADSHRLLIIAEQSGHCPPCLLCSSAVSCAGEYKTGPPRTNTANTQLSVVDDVFFRPRGREVKATVLYTVEAAAR